MAEESLARPFYTVLVLSFVCSALVAGAAVGLRSQQEANRDLDRKKHVLYAAGLYQPGKSIDALFAAVETRVVDLVSGSYIPASTISPETFNQLKAAQSQDNGRPLTNAEDKARLRRLEKYSLVYLIKKGDEIELIVLPVRGKGLWSTIYAYVAVDRDLATIRGVSFYEHGETPGLGGEIENKGWQKGWQGKKLYDGKAYTLEFVKGKAAASGAAKDRQIDGLSGATLTTKGVGNFMAFWFGDHGFKPFLTQLRKKEHGNG